MTDVRDDIAASRREIEALLGECRLADRYRAVRQVNRLLPARHPDKVAPKLAQLKASLAKSVRQVERIRGSLQVPSFPGELPITARRDEIVGAIRDHPVVVIAGETGSGKTTQIPKMCLEAGLGFRGAIGCTQPRRIAATSISQRIAQELKANWGREVGCKIRFFDRTTRETVIKVMTDGILLSELQSDRMLADYEVLIIDEAHERSVNIDFILGYLRKLREQRDDLKIIITSATIDTATFSKAFDNAPVIEVSGRTYPVEVTYLPIDELEEDLGNITYIEAAEEAIRKICDTWDHGDILCFLPTEHDIREARKALEKHPIPRTEVLSLFGRLSGGDQQKIFQQIPRRKVILSTNIAETSITVPGIRFVVDAGLARIKQYSAQTRTTRLPIAPISQSSARQRAGRCGRVADGVCIRLYSEEDFNKRDAYSTPEILRSNLSDIILTMLDAGIGEPDAFPFIDPPEAKAISAAFIHLRELGAIDEDRRLTETGRQLAQLPIDPTVARMLLEARHHHVLHEVLVIASALSIQDPREAPAEERDKARSIHRRFLHPESDFLSLLNLWEAVQEDAHRLSQRELRKFCKANYLSFQRMREWRELYDLLEVQLSEIGIEQERRDAELDYDGVHRSILAGLLGNVATRQNTNHYLATYSRKVMVHPGSTLFRDTTVQSKNPKTRMEAASKKNEPTPRWLVCAEWLQTSRLFALTCARIDPGWIAELGSHLFQYRYTEPTWEAKSCRVVCKKRALLYGLEVQVSSVNYTAIDAAEATGLFIQKALVEGDLNERFAFHEHNQKLVEELETWRNKMRIRDELYLEDSLRRFYEERITGVGNIPELHKFVKAIREAETKALHATREDLVPNLTVDGGEAEFPSYATLDGSVIPIEYTHDATSNQDGATVELPGHLVAALEPGMLHQFVPGLLRQQLESTLKQLPKDYARFLRDKTVDLEDVMKDLRGNPADLDTALSEVFRTRYNVHIPAKYFPTQLAPRHTTPLFRVVDGGGKVLHETRRPLEVFGAATQSRVRALRSLSCFQQAEQAYGKRINEASKVPDQPDRIEIGRFADIPWTAQPGLRVMDGRVETHLFPTRLPAIHHTRVAFAQLFEEALSRDLGWIEKDLRDLNRLGPDVLHLGGDPRQVARDAFLNARNYLCEPAFAPLPVSGEAAREHLAWAEKACKGLAYRLVDSLAEILDTRRKLDTAAGKDDYARKEIARLVPSGLLAKVDFRTISLMRCRLEAVPERARKRRAEPTKFAERMQAITDLKAEWKRIAALPMAKWLRPEIAQTFWMIEDLLACEFCPQIRDLGKVSRQRVSAELERLAGLLAG